MLKWQPYFRLIIPAAKVWHFAKLHKTFPTKANKNAVFVGRLQLSVSFSRHFVLSPANIFRRFATELLLETFAEITGGAETGAFSNVGDGHIAALQHLGSTVQTYAADKGHRRLLHHESELLV